MLLLDQEVFDLPFRDIFSLPNEYPTVILDLLSKTVQLFKQKLQAEGQEQAQEEAKGLSRHVGRLVERLPLESKESMQGVWREVMGTGSPNFE